MFNASVSARSRSSAQLTRVYVWPSGIPLLGLYSSALVTMVIQSMMGHTLRHKVHPVQSGVTLGRWDSGSKVIA